MSVRNQVNENLKKDFLAAFQEIEFSKNNEKAPKVVDIERRCLAVKYLAAQKLDSEDTAASLLSQNLVHYGAQVDDINGINNYWPQFQKLGIKSNNDPKQWKSILTDPQIMLQHLKPLPCQKDIRQPCIKKEFSDRHIEKLLDKFKNEESKRNRKLTKPADFGRNLETSANLDQERVRPHFNRSFEQKLPLNCKSYSNQENKSVSDNWSNFPKYRNQESKRQFSNRESSPEVEVSSKSNVRNPYESFKTARTELVVQQAKKNRQPPRKTLGASSGLTSKFVCPMRGDKDKIPDSYEGDSSLPECENELLKNIDPKMVEQIKNEIMDSGTTVTWTDIAGLEYAKRIIQEVVVIPMLRPELFTGLRQPPKGILLFGPPGTGKTLIGKCIASQSKSTFFSISASSLTSKWIGEGEKLVRALFAVARVHQPSVVFIDEIDSLLSQRSETEHESSRRMKTEFLVQLDGAATSDKDRILVLGATNRPYELDEAARRRLVKRLYIPLPEFEARVQIVENLLKAEKHELTKEDISEIGKLADGYSGADMTNLCKEASMGPIRSVPISQLENICPDDIRKITIQDFKEALTFVRPSVSQDDLSVYLDWDRTYGSGNAQTL